MDTSRKLLFALIAIVLACFHSGFVYADCWSVAVHLRDELTNEFIKAGEVAVFAKEAREETWRRVGQYAPERYFIWLCNDANEMTTHGPNDSRPLSFKKMNDRSVIDIKFVSESYKTFVAEKVPVTSSLNRNTFYLTKIHRKGEHKREAPAAEAVEPQPKAAVGDIPQLQDKVPAQPSRPLSKNAAQKELRYAKALMEGNKRAQAQEILEKLKDSEDDDIQQEAMYYSIIWGLEADTEEAVTRFFAYYPKSKYEKEVKAFLGGKAQSDMELAMAERDRLLRDMKHGTSGVLLNIFVKGNRRLPSNGRDAELYLQLSAFSKYPERIPCGFRYRLMRLPSSGEKEIRVYLSKSFIANNLQESEWSLAAECFEPAGEKTWKEVWGDVVNLGPRGKHFMYLFGTADDRVNSYDITLDGEKFSVLNKREAKFDPKFLDFTPEISQVYLPKSGWYISENGEMVKQ